MSVEKAAALPFPSQALVPHPFRLSAAAAGSGGAHPLCTRRAWRRAGGRGGAEAQARRRAGEEAEWSGWLHEESGARGQATRNEHRGERRSTFAFPRLARGECGGEAGFGGWVAAAARLAVVVPSRPPSHGSLAAPVPRSPASGDERRRVFGLSACWRRGPRGGTTAAAATHACHRPRTSTQPAPLLGPRQGGTPEHGGGAGGTAAVVLRVDDLRRGGRLQSQRRRRRWARRRWATRGVPMAAFAGSQLAPHACCGGPRSTFAVLPHCRLPPYPPIRVAPSAMPRSPARPGHPFPANLTPPVRHQQQAANTHQVIDETHVRYI